MLKDENPDKPESGDSGIASLIEDWQSNAKRTYGINPSGSISLSGSLHNQVIRPVGIPSEEAFGEPAVISYPDILLQAAVVVLGDKTSEGHLIQGVSIPWFEIIKQLKRDPDFLFQIPWRKLEEIIAGAYEQEGWPDVILTPRSNDGGRDVIATKPGFGSIRIIDQVKAYRPGHKVTADEVRAILGVLSADLSVSKGVITTSSTFAPGILEDSKLKAFMPYRLELKNGKELRQWLINIAQVAG